MNYSDPVITYFFDDRFVGELDPSLPHVFQAESGSIEQGAWIRMTLQYQQGMLKLCYKVYGEPSLVASCAYVAEQIAGKKQTDAVALSLQSVVEGLALHPLKVHCAIRVLSVLEDLLKQLTR